MKLSYKIFAAFLLTAFMVVALMVGIMRFYVARNFETYVNETALEELSGLIDSLAAEYEKQRGWHFLKNHPERWRKILRSSLRQSNFKGPPPPEPPDFNRPPFLAKPRGFKKDTSARGMHPHKPRGHILELARGLALFNAEKQHVAGRAAWIPSGRYTLRAIIIDDKTVGWLGLHKKEPLANPMVAGFLKQQSRLFFLTGGGILLLAAMVAFALSRHLLAPIQKLAAGTRALAALQFDTRITTPAGDELGQLAADFNAMADTLQKYEKMGKQWISDIAHELRTPLAILRGEIEALQDGIRKMDETALDSLNYEVMQLSRLVDDLHLLSLADSQSLSLRKDPVQPLQLLKETVESFGTRLKRQAIEVQLELNHARPPILTGDATHLTRLFSNLLENTLRYTDSPGILKIRETHTQTRLTLYFEDSAPGVPQKSLERLFDRLYRVDKSRSRALGGSGLGLSICKEIVTNHGGTIRAGHAPYGGLRIQIEFPLTTIH